MILKNYLCRNKKNNKKAGFTLVELTVSMGILALIVGLTAGILISVVRSYQRQRVISEIERNGDFVIRSLEESLREAATISCVDYAGDPISGQCNLMANHLIYLYGGLDSKYFGVGSDEDGLTTAQCDGNENCYVFVLDSISQIDANNLDSDDLKMTNSNVTNGVDIADFTADISGGGPTGAPYNIAVTIEVSSSESILWINETRTFQSFLTLRGSYQ